MSARTPNAVEFSIITDRGLPSAYLADGEIAALYGVPMAQVRRWHEEFKTTGTLSAGEPLPQDRAELIARIITKTLGVIVGVVEIDEMLLTPRDRIKHMEACAGVLAKIAPYAENVTTEAPMTAAEAVAQVLQATRGAERYADAPASLH